MDEKVYSRADLAEMSRPDQVRAGFIKVEPFYGVRTSTIVRTLDLAGKNPEFTAAYDLKPEDWPALLAKARLSREAILSLYHEAKAFLRKHPLDKQNSLRG